MFHKRSTIKYWRLATGLLLMFSKTQAQTYVSAPMTSTPAAGSYYSNTSIVLNPGFSFTAAAGSSLQLYIVNQDCVPLATALPVNQNYVATYMPRVAGITNPSAPTNSTCQVMANVQYIDGLGRPIQTVQVKGSPQLKDIVQPIAYDAYGRENTKYLPYALTGTAVSDGSYKSNALTAGAGQSSFYTTPPTGVSPIPTPQAVTGFEPSPLNRVIEQGAPGNAWQLSGSGVNGSGHTVKVAYGTNASEVIMWTVNSNYNGATGTSTYQAGSLYKTTTTDENGNNSFEYKDKEGNVVCKMVQNGSVNLATYYVYDDLNNLTYVIPPIPATTTYPTSFVETDAVFLNFIYGYHYDGRNRVIQKKIPGKGWEFMVYNVLDQVTFTQDANQRYQPYQLWTYIQYDAQGRVAMTGIWNSNGVSGAAGDASIASPSNVLQQWLVSWQAAQTTLWVTRDNTTPTGYGVLNPQGQILTINYYDDYSYTIARPAAFTAPAGASTNTAGLLTTTRTAVLNTINNATPDMLWTVNYYDDLGRVTQTDKQHYLGGVLSANNYDVITNTYDFTNAVTATTRNHYNTTNTTSPVVTIANTYVYDHEGRKKQTWEQINGGTNVLLVDDEYNEIGQLMTKNLHSTNSGSSYLQSTAYFYNERGWLSQINDPSVTPTATKLFGEKLNYNVPAYGALAQFNGNIAETDYNAAISGRQHVVYAYDPLNRLNSGTSSAGFSETGITYDNMGNIITLKRGANASTTYGYTGNQLITLTGYINGTNFYDNNGNLYTDGTRSNAAIRYNMLDLPQTVTATGVSLTYIYDANGTKLRKVSGALGITDYISGIQYKTNSTAIDFVQTEEGRAINTGSGWNYEYTLTDHLGNNRVTFDMVSGKTSEDDYYPFGLNVPRQANASNLYLYNKKELQNELTEYDYGARFYDPVIARWTTVDPKAELGRRETPYGYAFDDPMRFTDPDGMWPWDEALGQLQGGVNYAINSVKSTYNNAVSSTKGAYHKAAAAVSRATTATKKWTVNHKAALLETAKDIQNNGEATAATGSLIAAAGLPIAGVGAAPGAALATAGAAESTAGFALEFTVNLITGDNKKAGITLTKKGIGKVLEKTGSLAIDEVLPEASVLKETVKQGNSLFLQVVGVQTDKNFEKTEEKTKKEKHQ